ncbi:hypothetical protein BCL69_11492 [Nitrosomonas communis]|uniref:Uncharacterized protein n=1 Tax=Nitrosomonas communis TaxID=44574 RepID=A0A5D3Y6A6_9PROT|nr:hypothetical protein BCL69_11492 [Nitrosomonas communis]
MTNYEAIGRYHVAVKRVQELIAKRNNSLTRTSALINNGLNINHTTRISSENAAISRHCKTY